MPKPFDFGDVNLAVGGVSSSAHPHPETPFCVAILGDFSGRSNRKLSDPERVGMRRALLVDRDNFDDVLSQSGAELEFRMGDAGSLNMRFAELDDFHPDRVFERLEALSKLRELRKRVQDPSTFQDAADELGLRSVAAASARSQTADASPPIPPNVSQLASGSLLVEIIERTESRATEDRPMGVHDDVREFARRVAAEHLASTPDLRQPEVLAVVDRAIAMLMRAVLHNPDFQALEAAWRAVFLLVRRLETGSNLKLYLIDVSKEELAADLFSAQDLRGTGVYQLLVGKPVETPGTEPWALVVGNYSFGPEKNDVELLSRMARVADKAGSPFLAEGSPRLFGCSSLASTPKPTSEPADAWAHLRHLPEAATLGLAIPRLLLRLPYGKETSPVESFDFEEFLGQPVHEDYLWGNPAFAVALLLAQSFSESEWGMCPGMCPGATSGIDGLPLHVYRENGDSEVKPCAEVLLTEDAVDQLLAAGLMPLVSFKGRDSVRLVRFQSITDPPSALLGRWTR